MDQHNGLYLAGIQKGLTEAGKVDSYREVALNTRKFKVLESSWAEYESLH